MLDVTYQVTPLIQPLHQWEEVRPGTASNPLPRQRSLPTAFLADRFSFEDLMHGEQTPVADSAARDYFAPQAARQNLSFLTSRPISSPSNVESIADERIRLLAAKYAGQTGQTEIAARLAILNRRLAKSAPLVTVEQVAALEAIADELAASAAESKIRASRLGLAA